MGNNLEYSRKTAFERHYHDYVDVIFRLALFKTSNPDLAEDIVQDVFTKYFNYLEKNPIPKKPKSFIYQIARNLIIDHYRKSDTDSLDDALESGTQITEESYGNTHTENQADYRIAMDALATLDPEYRDIVYMRLVEQMSIKEIATVLDITPNNASVRFHRGRKKLSELIS